MSVTAQSKETTLINYLPVKRCDESLNDFLNMGLPGIKSEEYKHSPITRLLGKFLENFEGPNPSDTKNQTFKKHHDGIQIVFQNGLLTTNLSDLVTENGLFIEPLTVAKSISHPSGKDPFQVLNSARFSDGVKITVEKSAQISGPIEIIHFNNCDNFNQIAVPRIEIEVKFSGSVNVIENYQFSGEKDCLVFPVNNYFVHKNARLKTYTLQMNGRSQIHAANTYVTQERDSYYKNVTVSTSGKFIRNNHNIILTAENCESHLFGLTLTTGKDHIDHHTIVDHTKPNCFSNELYKGILKEKSTGVFNGRIYVRPNAQQTNAFQSNNNILLSEEATIHTKPQLEIWADDVKCSHGCTTGQLDEEALFYLRARGLDKNQATALLLKAFSDDVIQHIEIEGLKDLISEEVANLL